MDGSTSNHRRGSRARIKRIGINQRAMGREHDAVPVEGMLTWLPNSLGIFAGVGCVRE